MDDEHAGSGVVLTDDVLGEAGTLLSSGPGAQRLTDRDDVVVDGLGQTDDGEAVVVLCQVRGEVSGGGVGVVATDGVQDVDPVGDQTVSSNLEGIVALGDQTTLDEVGGIGELDAGVADRGTTETLEDLGVLAHSVGDLDEVSLEQALVAVFVGDDLDLGGNLGVALDQTTDRRGQAGRESTGGEESDLLDGHGKPFVRRAMTLLSLWHESKRHTGGANVNPFQGTGVRVGVMV